MAPYILLVILALSDVMRFVREASRKRRRGRASTLAWWCMQIYRFVGTTGAILVGLGFWLPTATFGWCMCGIAMTVGMKAPCGFSLINSTPWVLGGRNFLFFLLGMGCFAVSYGWLR